MEERLAKILEIRSDLQENQSAVVAEIETVKMYLIDLEARLAEINRAFDKLDEIEQGIRVWTPKSKAVEVEVKHVEKTDDELAWYMKNNPNAKIGRI